MKKFSALVICFLMLITFSLAGCAGFAVNDVKYLNDVVATVGNTKIKRHELLSAYSSYGQSYFGNQSEDSQAALESTLDLLIDRELLYQYALEHEDKYGLTEYQVNEVVKSFYDSFDEQMEDYVSQAKNILNIKSESEISQSSNNETAYKLEDYGYSPRAEVISVVTYFTDAEKTTVSETATEHYSIEYKIKYTKENEPTAYDKLISENYLKNYKQSGVVDEIKTNYLSHFKASLADEEKKDAIYNQSINLLCKDLINYEKNLRDDNGKTYNTKTDDLIYRYVERNFNNQIKSQYLTNLRTHYLQNEELKIELLTKKFADLVNLSYTKYLNREEKYKTDMKDIGTKGDTVLYHKPLSDGTQFGYFTHTLLSFSDGTNGQKTKLQNLEKNKDTMSEETYNTQREAIIAETTVKVRNLETGLINKVVDAKTGLEVDETKSLDEVLEEYNAITKIANYNEKLSKFTEFMFKYTGDTATLSAGMPYVVGTNGNSAMEQAFTDEAVRLMTDETVGAMTPAYTDEMCVTSYGIHLLFYVADVADFDLPYGETLSAFIQNDRKEDPNNLYYKIINPLTKETYFDMLFDEVYPTSSTTDKYSSVTGYSDFENNITNTNQSKVTKYTKKIKGTKV